MPTLLPPFWLIRTAVAAVWFYEGLRFSGCSEWSTAWHFDARAAMKGGFG